MNHPIIVEKYGVRLRPVAMSDADRIFELRRDPNLSKYIGEVDGRFSVHKAWLEQYFVRDGDYYFSIELSNGVWVGTIAIYNVQNQIAEWGRWIIVPSIPAAAPSAWLIYHAAFDVLSLSEVYCCSVAENKHVVSFHDRCGLSRTGIKTGGIQILGEYKDLVIHSAKRENWPAIWKKLEAPAKLAERLLQGVTP